jgi:hypothetical protein
MNVIIEEPHTSRCQIFVFIQPLKDLPISHTLIVKVLDDIILFRLVVGVCSNDKASSGQRHLETIKGIDLI